MHDVLTLIRGIAENELSTSSGLVVNTVLCIVITLILTAAIAAAVVFAVLWAKKRHLPEAAPAPARDMRPVTAVATGKVHEQGKREYQQDSFGVSDNVLMPSHGFLAIVADGMGGLADGDKVSARAVEEILDMFLMYQGRGNLEQVLLMLTQHAVQKVNQFLGEDNFRKSGSTLVMGLLKNSYFSFVSIGDSRILLWRDKTVIPLNREHIWRNDLLVRAVNNEIGLSDVYADKSGAGLTSYLGMGSLSKVDLPAEPIRVYPGDKIILMSDGIYNALSLDEICRALENPPEAAAEALRAAIEAKGYTNQDNYTGVILECLAEGPVSEDISADEPDHSKRPNGVFPVTEAHDVPKTEIPD